MPEQIPQQIKAEIKKEIDRRPDPSWIRKDYVIIGVLFVVLAVLSVVQIIALRENLEQTRKLGTVDRLMECFDPSTECGEEVERRDQEDREYFVNLMKVTGICTLITSGAVNNGDIPYTVESMTNHYSQCVEERTGPPPFPTSSTTTTTTRS